MISIYNIQKFRNFFENDVANVIEPMIKEWLHECDPATAVQDFPDHYKYAKLSTGSNHSNTFLDYYFMSEPYTHVEMDFNDHTYNIIIGDQMGIRNKFSTYYINEFIQYWNTHIVKYYRFNTTLPILHQVDE